jgi:hypothetical protein
MKFAIRAIAALLTAAAVLAAVWPPSRGSATGPAESCNGTWSVVAGPQLDGVLNAAGGTSPTDVWAVGQAGDLISHPAQTLIEHWDGNTWSVAQSPNPSYSRLSSVAVVSVNDVWAVGGSSSDYAQTWQTLVEHWDGNSWSIVPSPNPGISNTLSSVSAVSPNDVWAVGSSPSGSGPAAQTLVEHWDGSTWSVVPSPSPGNSDYLSSVSAVSPNDVWVVGTSSSDLHQTSQTLVERWDGNSWSIVPSPNPSESILYSVTVVSANDLWAVGASIGEALIEHWNGNVWSVLANPGGTSISSLSSVSAVSSNDVWAVSDSRIGVDRPTLIEHWDGSSWTSVPSPNSDAPNNRLSSVAAITSKDIWAVGNVLAGSASSTLIEHSCVQASTPTPLSATPTSSPASLPKSGGPVSESRGSWPQILVLAGSVLMLASGAAFVWLRRAGGSAP